ncbi:hypothetical protein MTO96_046833, partial [Rhipicephalus appendiculatus]
STKRKKTKTRPPEKPSGPQHPPTGDIDDPVIINDDGEIEEDSWEPVVIESATTGSLC